MSATPPPRIGLALAGGGPLGAIYEIGALCALEEAIDGLDCTAVDALVGVSAGAFIAAALANGLTPRDLCAAFIENVHGSADVIDPRLFTQPAWGEYRRRLAKLPGVLAGAAWRTARGRGSVASWMADAGQLLPNGVFDNAPLAQHLRQLFSAPGRSDDFRQLPRQLVVVATDLDTGEARPFGLPGHDEVPISEAVIASAALPGLYPPVQIQGRSYVDGALKKTVHASVLLDQGLDLLICLNPLVPFDASLPHSSEATGGMPAGTIPRLDEAGLPALLSQTFRSLIHSRLELGMKGYGHSHPDCDILLFEPAHGDAEMFHAGTFSYSLRRRLANHAFEQTWRLLRERAGALAPRLHGHGLRLRLDALEQPRSLVAPGRRRTTSSPSVQRAHQSLDRLERWLSRQTPG